MKKKVVGVIVLLSLNEGHQKKFPIQVHLVHTNIKYMAWVCKGIFRFQCGPAVPVAEIVVHTSVKQRAIAGQAQFI